MHLMPCLDFLFFRLDLHMLPNIEFMFGNKSMVLSPINYIMVAKASDLSKDNEFSRFFGHGTSGKKLGSRFSKILSRIRTACIPVFIKESFKISNSRETWIIGMPFMRQYTFLFQKQSLMKDGEIVKASIGFARTKGCCGKCKNCANDIESKIPTVDDEDIESRRNKHKRSKESFSNALGKDEKHLSFMEKLHEFKPTPFHSSSLLLNRIVAEIE
mmetsp:Transcript_6500/g.9019  ORF Transcript_6500/g.9019 Transcript_6500/m.9019 type:complete len:215 (-) Transcript_6500:80-724(-)